LHPGRQCRRDRDWQSDEGRADRHRDHQRRAGGAAVVGRSPTLEIKRPVGPPDYAADAIDVVDVEIGPVGIGRIVDWAVTVRPMDEARSTTTTRVIDPQHINPVAQAIGDVAEVDQNVVSPVSGAMGSSTRTIDGFAGGSR
jgi:hypothetical protein